MSEASEYLDKLTKLSQAGDYYTILGIPRGSDPALASKAFKTLGLQWHPDKNPSEEATAIFKLLTGARDNIINPASSYSDTFYKTQNQYDDKFEEKKIDPEILKEKYNSLSPERQEDFLTLLRLNLKNQDKFRETLLSQYLIDPTSLLQMRTDCYTSPFNFNLVDRIGAILSEIVRMDNTNYVLLDKDARLVFLNHLQNQYNQGKSSHKTFLDEQDMEGLSAIMTDLKSFKNKNVPLPFNITDLTSLVDQAYLKLQKYPDLDDDKKIAFFEKIIEIASKEVNDFKNSSTILINQYHSNPGSLNLMINDIVRLSETKETEEKKLTVDPNDISPLVQQVKDMEEIKPIVTAQLARYKPSALHTRTNAITALKDLLSTPGITKDEFTKALRAVKEEAAKDHNSHLSAKLFGRSSFLVRILSDIEKKLDQPATLKDEKTAEHSVRPTK